MRYKNILYTLIIGSLFIFQAQAQDLEKLKDYKASNLLKAGVTVKGMIGATNTYLHNWDMSLLDRKALPFTALYTGNLQVNLFGKINMPVSFVFSNQNINFKYPLAKDYRFAQPFNRLVLKPKYKGLTLHIGTCALTFSPYTLAGHRYDGVGLEYKPQKKPYYFGFMLGNLQRAVRIDSSFSTINNQASYKRFGWGIMAGMKKGEDRAEVILFTAKDKINSLPYYLDVLNINPMENVVLSLKGQKVINKVWQLSGELAYSGITTDSRAIARSNDKGFTRTFGGLLSPKATTDYYTASKVGVMYRAKKFMSGFEYSRIDPGYRTLGAYYFVNDLESFSLKGQTQLKEGKISMSGNLGVQHDNVLKQKLKTTQRIVGTASITLAPSEKVNALFNYSTFTNYSNLLSTYAYLTQITPYNYLDTLNYRQINQNLQAGLNLLLPSAENRSQSLAVSTIAQKGDDQQGSQINRNNLMNINIDYSYQMKDKKVGFSLTGYYSQSHIGAEISTQLGPALTLRKEFFSGALKSNLQMLYSWGSLTLAKEQVANLRLGASYSLMKKHNFTFNGIYLSRQTQSTERYIPSFRELSLSLGYSYQFTVAEIKKK